MKYKIIYILAIAVFFGCNEDQKKSILIDKYAACELCVLDELSIINAKYFTVALAKEDVLKIDVLRNERDSIFSLQRDIIREFSEKNNIGEFRSEKILESTCYNNNKYGDGLSTKEKLETMSFLMNEIINYESGHSFIEGAYLDTLSYRINEFGDTLIWQNQNHAFISNFENYRENRIIEWNQWMTLVNFYLKKFTDMEYGEMSEREFLLLKFKLRYFKNEIESMGKEGSDNIIHV